MNRVSMKTPSISIIIPTFLEEKYVATTLSRLIKIDPQLEIIVVDGKSKDNTFEIARRYTDKVYEVDERGISKAKNYGAKHSNSDLLLFLDADVIPEKDFIEKVSETFQNPKVVGATCKIMPAQPRLMEAVFFIFYNFLIRICTFIPHTKLKHSRGEFLVVRKNQFQLMGGFNESIACLEDYDLACRISEVGKLAFINDLTVYESMRRIRKKGLFKTIWMWVINFISYIILGEPVSKVWQPVR